MLACQIERLFFVIDQQKKVKLKKKQVNNKHNNPIASFLNSSISQQLYLKSPARMQLYRTEDSLCQKISSSIKKSHKISILSKKQGKSPKKNEISQGAGRGIEQGSMLGSVGGGNGSARQGNNSNNMTGNRNHNTSMQHQSKPQRIISQQATYVNQHPVTNPTKHSDNSAFFPHYTSHMKKANTISYEPTPNQQQTLTNKAYNYSKQQSYLTTLPNNSHNISSMIQKQAQSQINNQSQMGSQIEMEFMTGNRGGSSRKGNLNGTYSGVMNNSGLENKQETMLLGIMQLMHQQIKVAKENCQRKFSLVIKDNVSQIQDLREKLNRNQKMLKDKEKELEGLRVIIKRAQAEKKKIMSQGQINLRANDNAMMPDKLYNPKQKSPQPQKAHNYYRTRIHDLEAKLKLMVPQHTPNIQTKIQILETHLLAFHSAKLSSLQSLVNGFVTSRESRLFEMRQLIEASVGQFTQKLSSARQQYEGQVKLVNEIQRKVKSIEGEVREFLGKEWKYENYAVQQVKREVQQFKEKLRYFQSMQFQNTKLTAKLTEQLNRLKINNIDSKPNIQTTQTISAPQPLTSLSNINETASKYTLTNNISKISLSDLSNTHEYSHLLEKMTPGENVAMGNDNGQVLKFNRQKSPLQSNLNNQSQSLISMSFTEEAAESVRQPLKSSIKSPFDQQSYNAFNQQEQPSKYSYEQQFVPAQQMSKLTKTTDLKDTMAQISPQRPTKYYVPSQTRTIPSQVINDTSTKQKIGRLNELKMQNLRDGSSFTSSTNGKIPNKPTQKNPPEGKSPKHSHLYLDNNTSHWSISQLEDYNMSRDIPMSQVTDFSDDEFFYLEGMTEEEYVKRKGYLNTPVKTQGSIQQSPMGKKFAAEEEFSPMTKKMVATEQNFYNTQLSLQKNGHEASKKRQPKANRQKNSFLYNSSFDFQKFSSDEDQPQSKPKPNHLYSSNSPTPKQNFTHNQHSILQHIHNLPKSQLPIKVIYDRKKCEGIFKLSNQNHSLNGKAFTLALHQLQKLQSLGYLAVRTYV